MTLLNHWGKRRVEGEGGEEGRGKQEREVRGGRGKESTMLLKHLPERKTNLLNQPFKGENSENETTGS